MGVVRSATVTSCYATGNVEGINRVGGLIGLDRDNNSTITSSYYDGDHATVDRGVGSEEAGTAAQEAMAQSRAALQGPRGYEGIYADWGAGGRDPWSFSGGRYPKLKADWDGDGIATAAEFGPQMLAFIDDQGAETPIIAVFGSVPAGVVAAQVRAINLGTGAPAEVSS